MNETQVLRGLAADLQRAPARKVLYLEGKTDLPIFFGLLGVPAPRDGVHEGVLVREVGSRTAVAAHVSVAAGKGAPFSGVHGIVDGDGTPFAELVAAFNAPDGIRFYRWPAYCIENMLAKTGWPSGWGAPPDWTRTLLDYAPYVALNKMHSELLNSLKTLRLGRFQSPVREEPPKTVEQIVQSLASDKHLLGGYDAEKRFLEEVASAQQTITRSLDEGHAIVNGKWLVHVFAPRRLTGAASPDICRDQWISHAVSVGGSTDVRGLWHRIRAV